jgi:ABC-type transporter Mla subunit MlaD
VAGEVGGRMTTDTKALAARLRASAHDVQSWPHPSQCDHLHVAYEVMREAAALLESQDARIAELEAAVRHEADCVEAAKTRIAELEAALAQSGDILPQLRDTAAEAASAYHEAMRGYRPDRHKEMDEVVHRTDNAIAAVVAAAKAKP